MASRSLFLVCFLLTYFEVSRLIMCSEARDRIGGRIHQTVLPTGATVSFLEKAPRLNYMLTTNQVDMGPNWVHGTENNTIHDLAKATKTSVHAVRLY